MKGGRSVWRVRSHVKVVGVGGPGSRDVVADGEREAERWRRLAPVLGYCGGCGARVDEKNGKLHDEGCIPSQPDRCTPGQRS